MKVNNIREQANIKVSRYAKRQNVIDTMSPKAFLNFENKVIQQTQKKEIMCKKTFALELGTLIENFQKQGNIQAANKIAKRLAERLVSLKNYSFAGIIYSILIKKNPDNHQLIEVCEQNARKIANRLGDWVHGVARSFELKEDSKGHIDAKDKYRKNLYKTKRYLTRVCKQYDEAQKRYVTINREIKPKETYQYMLAKTLIEIANLVKDENPKEAIGHLEKALKLFKDLNFKKQEISVIKQLKQLKKR